MPNRRTLRPAPRLARLASEPTEAEADDHLVAAGGEPVPALPIYAVAADAILAEVGTTADGREILAYGHRELPIDLFAQFRKDHGNPVTEGNPLVGQVQSVTVDGDLVRGRIVYFDTPEGRYAAQLAASGSARYVSVDPGAYEHEYVVDDPETGAGHDRFNYYEIGAATQVAVPAYRRAAIGPVTIPNDPQGAMPAAEIDAPAAATFEVMRRTRLELPGLTAAGRAVDYDAFHIPEPDDPLRYEGAPTPENIRGTRLSVPFVEDDGTWHGYLCHWGTCHVGYSGVCRTPPTDDDFAGFYRQVLTAAGGDVELEVGHVTLGAGHARLSLNASAAAEHYDDTAARVAYGRFVNGRFGIWGSGVINPAATDEQVANFHRSRMSGDWRTIGGRLRLIAALVVNYPGFPIPDIATGRAADGTEGLVAAGLDIPDEVLVASGAPASAQSVEAVADRLARSVGLPTAAQKRAETAAQLAARVGTPKRRVTRPKGR